MELVPKMNGRWIEPFLGTGVVAFNSGYKNAILNETNPHIINFYKGIQNRTITPEVVRHYLEREGELLKKAEDKGYEHFRKVRDRFNKKFSPLDFLFLSRAGFNGMIRFNKNGDWNIPFCKKPERFSQAYTTKIVNQVLRVSMIIRAEPDWIFMNKPFSEVIPLATKKDIIYCDPPYFGRYVDYYNGWQEKDEELLFTLLSQTKAHFILSTWHHNDYRHNDMIKKYWNKFNIVTRDHFYHSGGKIENRRSVVEALVFNYDIQDRQEQHYQKRKMENLEQLSLHF
jgi:DNA adenine methylase